MTLDLYTSLSLAGGLISLILAPLGCLLLWQRKSLLSDSLSHASFLGMSIAYVFKFPLALGVALSSLAVLSTMKSLFKQSSLKMDVWLNLIAVSALGLGGMLLSLYPTSLHLESLFYGDFLLLSFSDLFVLFGLLIGVYAFLKYFYRAILLSSLNEDLAHIHNLNTKAFNFCFIALLLLVLSLTLKLVGVLLVSGMMLLPSAWSVLWSKNPKEMLIFSSFYSFICFQGGLFSAYYLDLAASQCVIVMAFIGYVVSLGINRVSRKNS